MSVHIALILDRSGSMNNIKESTIESYNELVQQVKSDAQEKDIFVSLVTFNGHVYEHHWREPASKLRLATKNSYDPSGSTALQDALGYTCDKIAEDPQEDDQVFINVFSDGQENSSHQYKREAIQEVIQSRSDWEFNYIGCEADWIEKEYGVHNTVSVDMTNGDAFLGATRGLTATMANSYDGTPATPYICSTDGDEEEPTDEVFGEFTQVV